MKYIKINDNLYDVVNRIKQIDSKYFVLFNIEKKKFEVHYQRAKNTYELTLPFDELDARAVYYVQKTKIENQQRLYAEMKAQNQKLEKEKQERQIELLQRRVYES